MTFWEDWFVHLFFLAFAIFGVYCIGVLFFV